ncbi:hypothetical protein BKA93DRAFT_760290 [Sparassis latifolia]
MNPSVYLDNSSKTSGPSSSPLPLYRPATIAELAARAKDNLWDPSKGVKHWLRTAEKARRAGSTYLNTGDFERAFVEYAKAATIVLERLPTHKDYHDLLSAEQRHNLGMNGQDILDNLSRLKPVLVDRYETWQARNEAGPNGSRPSSSHVSQRDGDGASGGEASRRRLEELGRAKEEERARQALEAARREQDWQREDMARRQAEEQERTTREETEWVRQSIQSKRRETMVAAAESRRAQDALAMAEHERAAQAAQRLQAEEGRKEGERIKKRVDERTRQEQEGIARRQQEAEAAALAARFGIATQLSPVPALASDPENSSARSEEVSARSGLREFPVAAPQPGRPPNSTQRPVYADSRGGSNGLSVMPLESPTRYDDDSSTDVEGADRQAPWHRARNAELTPTKARNLTPSISYPPPITTTSPPPPELGSIRYPALMSQHQLKQGYVPSLQSMFSKPSADPRASDASLLFDSKSSGSLYSNILPAPSAPVIPPYPANMPMRDSHNRHPSQSYPQHFLPGERQASSLSGPRSASSSQLSVPSSRYAVAPPPRIVQSTSADSAVSELRTIKVPKECLQRFLLIARVNTLQNKETCGLLLGKDKGTKFVVTTLLVPKQHATCDTCYMEEEELVLQFTEERQLITLGWIHTHPTQSCFMSSVDLHTHSGFQRMLPESFAVVCAPSSSPTFGIFRLTNPGGLQTILDCTAKEAFHPHPEVPIYTDCDKSHVQMKDMPLEIVDLRV